MTYRSPAETYRSPDGRMCGFAGPLILHGRGKEGREPQDERTTTMTTTMTTTTKSAFPTSDEREVLLEDRMTAAYRIPEAADKRLEEALAQSNELESGCFIGDSTEWIWGDAMYPETLPRDEWAKISAMWDDEGHAGYYVYLGELEPLHVSYEEVRRAAMELRERFFRRCVCVEVDMGFGGHEQVQAQVNCASIGAMTPAQAEEYAATLAEAIAAAKAFEYNGCVVDYD